MPLRAPVPIFVICRDRIQVLEETLRSFQQLRTPVEIILFDQLSTYPPMVEYLASLEAQGHRVIRNGRNTTMDDLIVDLRLAIQHHLSEHPCDYYVVTDSDVALDGVQGDMLDFYAFILDHIHEIICVGPQLRIDDLPQSYPFKDHIQRTHGEKFWSGIPLSLKWRGVNHHLRISKIDTTFAMYRASYPFSNYNDAFRSYAPYMARHLDWYIDPDNMSPDQAYYMQHANHLAHWGGQILKKYLQDKA